MTMNDSPIRLFFAASWKNLIVVGMLITLLSPVIFVPLNKFLTVRKRSINRNLYAELPDDYWFVVTRNIIISSIYTSIFVGWAARNPQRILWLWSEATLCNTVGSFAAIVLLREIPYYWIHRFQHSKLLYKFFHEKHHKIPHCGGGLFDGMYIGALDFITLIMPALFTPYLLIPKTHVLVVTVQYPMVALFAALLNHCGREVKYEITLPWLGQIEIFNNQHHDDHHVYRHGNYSDLIPALDRLFGTDLIIPRRRTLPAKKNWRKVQNAVLLDKTVQTNSTEETKDYDSSQEEEENSLIAETLEKLYGVSQNDENAINSLPKVGSFRHMVSQLLEPHADCVPAASLQTSEQVIERRKSIANTEPVRISSFVGRRLTVVSAAKKLE